MKPIYKLIFTALIFCLPLQTLAWGMLGHRVVGQIADSYINPKTRAALHRILGDESIAMASTWADFIKADQAYSYLSPWHYVDFNEGLDRAQFNSVLKQDTLADAYTKLNFIISQLKNKSLPLDKQRMYVRLLIHIVGDIHQPMHTGRVADAGGNKIIVLWGGDPNPTNLHSVWDSKIIDSQQLSYTEYATHLNHTTAAQRAELQKTDLGQWIFESYQISQKLYTEISEPNQKLGYRYTFDHLHIAEQQMLKGGVRLAGLLNQLFGA